MANFSLKSSMFFSVLFSVIHIICASKLNIPKVLLPLARGTRINFTLEATQGCYRWSSTRPQVASIRAVNGDSSRDCSQTAVLQAFSTQPSRLTSIILAEDVVTGQVLRCDAIVDIISEIRIVSTTRELHLEDSPLELSIHARDSEGNTFSTLAGLVFDWTIVKDADVDGYSDSYNSLRALKFSESTYTPPGYITEMERAGKQGDIILVSGLKTGHAKLKAKIQESLYEDVGAAEVKLLILENILLSPAHDVYLLAGTAIKYKVQKIRQGKITELPMPCDQYELHLQNGVVAAGGEGDPERPVASLDQATSTVTGLQLGHVNVVLDHKSLRMQGVSRLPNSTLHVVEPGYLGFRIHPGDSWVLETGRTYDIVVEVYGKSGNKIYLSDNVRIETVFPGEYFEVLESSLNGSYHRIKAQRDGQTLIDATLRAVVDQSGGVHALANPVHNEQDVEVYKPIVLSPGILTFPWQPKVGSYQYTIQAEGGSGNFSWSSSHAAVATVTVRGVMTTVSDIGVSTVYAHDMRNHLHYGQMKVYVVEPVAMDFAPCPVEARVGNVLELPLRIFGLLGEAGPAAAEERVMLSDCSHFHLQVEDENQGVFELLEEVTFEEESRPESVDFPSGSREGNVPWRLAPGQGHCSGVSMKGLAAGYTVLTVSYTHGNVHLSAKITIAAYLPLRAVDPVSLALVTLGSSKDMRFDGGPKPWLLEPSKFFRNLKAEDQNSVGLSVTGPPPHNHNHHWVRATCRALGEQILELSVGNQPSLTNSYPAEELAVVKFVCAPPSRLTLVPVYSSAQLDLTCPLLQQNKQVVPVSNYHNPVLDLAAFDREGRRFDNFSSLSVAWESTKLSLASVQPSMPMELKLSDDGHGQMKLHGRQTVLVHHQTGIAGITASALSYQRPHLDAAKVLSPYDPLTPVSATLDLLLVEDVTVTPNALTIYNHPDVRADLSLREGSGHFFVNTSLKGVAEVAFRGAVGTAQVVPVSAGTVEVMVHDLCLAFQAPATATVHVSDILEVYVRVVDKVEIGQSVRAHVRALDDRKKPFPAKYFNFMNLKLKAASGIVSLQAEVSERDTAVFLVKGLSIGQTSLSAVVVDKRGRKVASAPQPIEVFPTFKLIPRKMTLLIGAMMQITSEGGPQPQSNILFSMDNQRIASVGGVGHVRALTVGNVTVTGLVQAVDTDTGKLIVVSQDRVEVEVVQLEGIRIRAPITRMKSGTQMPVYVMGLTSSHTPFSFGNALPGLVFHWSTTKRDVLDVQSRHSEANIHLAAEHNFAMSVAGRSRGRTGLKVVLRAADPRAGQLAGLARELSDEVQIQVYDKLHMVNPEVKAEEILMAPNSVLKLQTSRDGVSGLSYRMLDCPGQAAVAQVDDKGVLSSGSLTGSSSLLVTSQEAFGINQTLVLALKVEPVSYVRFSSALALHPWSRQTPAAAAIPLGAALTFTVHFHANTGETLHGSSSLLTFSTDRDDLVQVSAGPANNSVTVRTVNVGLTLLAVWERHQVGVADYLPLPVAHAILPAEAQALVAGDVVCFATQLASPEGTVGTWSSSASGVLQVDPHSGVGVARDPGVATVYYELPGVLRTYREVVVEASAGAVVIGEPGPVRSNQGASVLISTRETGTNLVGSCSPAQTRAVAQLRPETSVSCHVGFTSDAVGFPAEQALSTRTTFDSNAGLYACAVELLPLSEAQTRALSVTLTHLLVAAALRGAAPSGGPRASARLALEPGLYPDRTELTLSTAQPVTELTVYGPAAALPGLEVSSSSPSVVVQEKETHTSSHPTFSRYTVSTAPAPSPSSAVLSVRSAAMGQTLRIPVTLEHATVDPHSAAMLGSSPGPASLQSVIDSYQMMFFTVFALLAATAIIIIVCHAVFSPRDQGLHAAAFVQRSPTAPGFGSPAANPFNHTIPPHSDPKTSPKLRLFSPGYRS